MTLDEVTLLAYRLSDWEFETLLRTRVRAALTRLNLVTDGENSQNRITFNFSAYKVEWAITAGKTFDSSTTSRGEVLSALTSVATCYLVNLERTKMALLAAPPAPPPAASPDLPPMEDDEDMIF